MQPEVFDAFRDFIHVQTGLTMRRGKESLLRARISERMRALGLEDEGAYLTRVRSDTTGAELRVFINAITTNTTSFFRAPEHFDTLGAYARAWDAQGQTRMRVWCSASSTGEEPWSMAMVLADALPDLARRDVKVLATDIDTDVLAEAKAGRYRPESLTTVPPALRNRSFVQERHPEGVTWSIRPELRPMVSFARLNLVNEPLADARPLRRDLLPQRTDLLRQRHAPARADVDDPPPSSLRAPRPRTERIGDGVGPPGAEDH